MAINPLHSLSDTVTAKACIADMIDIVSPRDVPMTKRLGMDGDWQKFRLENSPSTYCKWFTDELSGLTSGLAATVASDATTINVTSAHGYKFRPGNVLRIDTEYLWVSSVSTDTLTVSGGYAGSTRATHATGTTNVELITQADLEGSTDTVSGFTTPGTAYNYSQIFRDVIVITGTEEVLPHYGMQDMMLYQQAKKFPEMLRKVEQALFLGQRTYSTTPTTGARSFGGLGTFITTNTSSLSDAELTFNDLMSLMQTVWENSEASAHLIVCNGFVKRKISSLFESYIRTERSEKTGGYTIDTIESEFGDFELMLDRYCPKTSLYILDEDRLGILPVRPWFREELAKDGDRTKWQLVGEYTFVVQSEKAHAIMSSISTTT